jgi:hypothetical protein
MKLKGRLGPFLAAFVAFCVVFLLLDVAVMNMQGLNLIFEP